ncbi:MAG: DUF2948 family protein [Pseudomonadota bacterium]
MAEAQPLRLMAADQDDLKFISAALQDAVAKAGGIRYQASKRRFSIELNRFRWEDADAASGSRVRSIFAVDGVEAVRARGITKSDPELVISLLSAGFEPASEDPEDPSGTVLLTLAGDGEILLEVECLDITLLDSETVWSTRHVPSHQSRRR